MTESNFINQLESFLLGRNHVGIGSTKELPTEDASLLAKHVDGHPETLYVASNKQCIESPEMFESADAATIQKAADNTCSCRSFLQGTSRLDV